MKLDIFVHVHDAIGRWLLIEARPEVVNLQERFDLAKHVLKDGEPTAEAFAREQFTFMDQVHLLFKRTERKNEWTVEQTKTNRIE